MTASTVLCFYSLMYFNHSTTYTPRIQWWSQSSLVRYFIYSRNQFLDTELCKQISRTLASAQHQRFHRYFKNLAKLTKLVKMLIFYCNFTKEGHVFFSFEVICKECLLMINKRMWLSFPQALINQDL